MEETTVRSLVSMALMTLQEQGKSDAVYVIRNSKYSVEYSDHDNWDGGIDYYILVFELKRRHYISIEPNKEKLIGEIYEMIKRFSRDDHDVICGCDIKAAIEECFDWTNILPLTKDDVLQMIHEEKELLEGVATGKIRYTEEGIEQGYEERHKEICSIAGKAGFDYPVKSRSLAEWWAEIKNITTYAERRKEISDIFSPLLEKLEKSEESEKIEFTGITDGSQAVKIAIEDANLMIGNGNYESAVDRIHTVFHGHLRDLVRKHGAEYSESDNLSALYNKLHSYYGRAIQPSEMAERIQKILRSGAGMVTTVNEIRNNNTVAHPNEQLIQKREAELVIHIVNAVVNYIDDIEHELDSNTVC